MNEKTLLPGNRNYSHTFRTMPIKHPRCERFVTLITDAIWYPLNIKYISHNIEIFHQHFFNLPPDNEYIEYSIGKAMYLADGSALKQKKSMEEKGFFSDLVSSSAVCSIICDSINIDHETNDFTFYGRQLIKRRTSQIKRSMITTGRLHSVPRSKNNPHGLMIVNWRTLENKDIK